MRSMDATDAVVRAATTAGEPPMDRWETPRDWSADTINLDKETERKLHERTHFSRVTERHYPLIAVGLRSQPAHAKAKNEPNLLCSLLFTTTTRRQRYDPRKPKNRWHAEPIQRLSFYADHQCAVCAVWTPRMLVSGKKPTVTTRSMTVGSRSTIAVRDILTRDEMAQNTPLGVPNSATFCATDQAAKIDLNNYLSRG
jgi:hypothetical protein